MSRTPPSLEYLVIWNRTLQPAENVSKDDDDAQEEAHILFYTCRPGGVKRDKMLRQVGLAKALISFSETFTNDNSEACEMVRSARTRLVMVSPEKEYWINACVNVAYTETKSKEGVIKKEYDEASVHDSVLRTVVLRGYHEFKLLNGPFSRLLSRGRASLEKHLEKFFTIWAWKWDLEQPTTFISHIGVPLSPYNKYIAPLLEDVKPLLPESTPIILLTSSDVLAASPPPSSSSWNILPSHLMHHVPPYDPPTPSSSLDTTSDTQGTIVKRPSKRQSGLISPGSMDAVVRTQGMGANATATLLHSMPNMKKLAGYFTFSGRSSPALGVPSAQSALAPPRTGSAASTATKSANSADDTNGRDTPSKVDDAEGQTLSMPTPSHPVVDQKSLEEAIGSSSSAPSSIGANPIHDVPASASTSAVTTNEAEGKEDGGASGPKDGETPSASSQVPFVSPTLGYLSGAAEGLMNVFSHPTSVFHGRESMEPATSIGDAKGNKEGVVGHAIPVADAEDSGKHDGQDVNQPTVEIIDVDADAQGEETKTERSDSPGDRGRNHTTPAQRSLQRVLSRSVSRASLRPSPADNSAEGSKDVPVIAQGSQGQDGQELQPTVVEQPKNNTNEDAQSLNAESTSSPKTTPSSPPDAFFVPLTVYLEDEDTKELTLRRVYHISVEGLMLALVLNSSPSRSSIRSPDTPVTTHSPNTLALPSQFLASSPSRRIASLGGIDVIEGLGYPAYVDLPRGIEYPIIEILKKARGLLNKWQTEVERNYTRQGHNTGAKSTSISSFYGLFGGSSGTSGGAGLSSAGSHGSLNSSISTLTSQAQGMRHFAVANGDEHDGENPIALASLGFASTAGWLFEGRSVLQRDETIIEQFSRTTTSQSWYISKRITPLSKQRRPTFDGGKEGEDDEAGTRREVHMEIGRKEASLVDVDNDLVSMLRKLEAMKY